MSKALYVPCYPGELGWELINYVPHVNYICSKTKYDEVHVVVRKGREALYPMATRCYPILLSTKKSMGNSGVSPPNNNIFNELKKRFKILDTIKVPKGGCKYVKHRKHLKYQANEDALLKWGHIPKNSVVFCIRGRKFGVHKNWSPQNWQRLISYVIGRGFTPVVSGIKELVVVDFPDRCINVQDKTSMGDLLAIMQRSRFVVGQSTGPLHFASLSGVPHAVWGSSRIRDRYIKDWNPHLTTVEYQVCPSGGFDCPLKDAIRLVDRIIARLDENSV